MSREITHGSTDQRIRLRILDADGLPATGVAYDATGIGVSYHRMGSTAATVTLASGSGIAAPHSNGKWNEIGNGWYQIDVPDAAFAKGVKSVAFYGGATGYTFLFEQIELITASHVTAAYLARFPGYSNVWFVDGNNGDSTYSGKEIDFALDTLTAAQSAASAGDLIVVLPATYSEDTLGKNGVDWYFHNGASIVNGSSVLADDVFTDGGSAATFKVMGEGVFSIANGDVLHIQQDGSEVWFEFDRVVTTAGRGFAMEGDGRQHLKGNTLKTVNGAIDQFNASGETWFDIREIESAGFCLENDGGSIIGRSQRIVSTASSAIDMSTGTGVTAVDVQYVAGSGDAAVNHGNETATLVIRGATIDGPDDGAITMQANSVLHLVGCSINGTISGGTPVYSLEGLPDNAITSAKYDESTAFPLRSADTGSTQVARTGADGDTLKSLSDQLDGVTTLVGSANVTITSPVPNATTIELIEGDRYDGTRSPKLSWTVAKDYSGTTITLNIWRVNDDDTTTSMFTGSGAVDSSTEVSVTMTATFLSDVDYEGCPAFEKLQFALTATASGDDETIARGNCYVYQRIEG